MADDTPVLKLRFIDASDARMELEVVSWLAEGGFSTIALPAAEVRAVRATLLASSSLIPRSVCTLGSMEVAYLPRGLVVVLTGMVWGSVKQEAQVLAYPDGGNAS